MSGPIAYYWGCWDRAGHYFHNAAGKRDWYPEMIEPGLPWSKRIDGGLLKDGGHPDVYDGRVFPHCAAGIAIWHGFVWWDNSVDRRGMSNSGFYVRGFNVDAVDAAFKFACEQFPHVVARQRHPLVLQR